MKYTVTWKPSVKERLAEIWMTAPDRKAVTTAADAVDGLLRDNPLQQGESRSGDIRVLIVSPLAVVYEVRNEDRLVEVLAIRHVPVRGD